MKIFSKCFSYLLLALLAFAFARDAGAATRSVVWNLPDDWDANVVYDTTAGYVDVHGGDLQRRYGLGGVGEPDLPTLTVNVALPDGGALQDVAVTAAEWVAVETDGRWPLPVAEPVQYGAELVYPTPEPGAYAQVYPSAFAVAGRVDVSGGVRIVPIAVTPYKWDGAVRTLFKAKTLTVRVDLSVRSTLRLAAAAALSASNPNSAKSRALARTINPEDAARSGGLRLSAAPAPSDGPGEIIIISPSEFVDLWKGYAAYRKATEAGRNFDYVVMNTMDIYTNRLYWTAQCDATRNVARDDNADALAIHHYLEKVYKPEREQYVILGAAPTKYRYDRATMVPARYVVNQNSYDQVCDMYYGYMDRKNGKGEIVTDDSAEVWDYNLDGWYMGAKNAGGGYTSDNNNYVDWEMDVPVTRVPLMREVAETKDGKVYRMTAAQIMDNFTNRITFAENPATWTPDKSWRHVLGGGYLFNSYGRGSQDGLVQGEHTFFDGGINFFHKDHSSPAPDAEACPRQRQYEQYSYYRAARHGLINSGGLVTCAWGKLYQNFGDFFDVHCHGWARGADPGTTGGALFSTGTWRVYNMALPCETGMYDYCPNGSFGITNCVSMGESPHLCYGTNPNDPRNVGGGLVSFNNSRYGWWGGYGGMSSHMEGLVNQAFLQHELNAGQACRWIHNATSLKTTGSRGGACNLEVIMHGDPLIRISPQYDRCWNAAADVRTWTTNASAGAGWDIAEMDGLQPMDYTKNLRVDASGKGDVTFDVADDLSAARFALSGDAGRTITLAGTGTFRTTDATVVTNANLAWNVAGGAGRNGIAFVGDACDLTFEGSAARYVGYRLRNVRNLNVSGFNVTFDSDKGRRAEDDFTVQRFGFVGDNDLASETNGWYNVLRSRNPAFIPQTMTIPVVSNRLELQTYNIGGSGDANKDNPLFYLTNAYLKVTYNPYWLAENFVRPTYMTDSHVVGAYSHFGFGCASGTSGYDLYVWGKSSIEGEEPIGVNGELRIHLMDRDAELEIANPMKDGSTAGSVRIIDETQSGAGKVRITATQTFSAGVTVENGATLELGIAKAVSCDVMVRDGAWLVLDAIPLEAVRTVTLQDGAAMVLPGPTGAGIYQIIDSATSRLVRSDGAALYDRKDLDHALQGRASEGYFLLTDNLIYWNAPVGVWKDDPDDASCWQKANGDAVAFTNTMPVVFRALDGASGVTVTVDGTVRPGYVDFDNAGCPYAFVGPDGGAATLAVESLASSHDVTFDVNLAVDNVVKALGGMMTATNVTAAQVEVATNGVLHVTGDVRVPVKKVKAIKFSFAATQNAGNVAAVQELRLFRGDAFVPLPVGTTIEDVAGQKIRITGYAGGNTWAHDCAWVTTKPGNENESLKALVDGVLGNNNKWWPSRSGAPVWFTVVFPEPQEIITGYALRAADYAPRTPKAWSVYTSADGAAFGLAASVDDFVCGKTQQWMGDGGGTVADFGLQRVDGTMTVHAGGVLYADGDLHTNLAFQPGATLAVTNGCALTRREATATLALPETEGSVSVDASHATATSEAFPILSGFALSPADFLKFRCVTDSAVLNLRDGDLYVVTAGIRESPYAATVDVTAGSTNWCQLAWRDRSGTPFAWDADVNYRSDGEATVDLAWVDGQVTALDLDIGGALGKLELKGAASDALTLRWRAALVPRTLVFSNYNGSVRLEYGSQNEFALGYSDFVAGRDTEIPVSSAGSLFVGAGQRAIIPGWDDFARVTGDGTLSIKASSRSTAVASDWAIANRVTGTNELLCGTWEATVAANTAGHEYPLGKEVRIGANGILKLTTKNDTTGYGTYETGLTLADGGEMNVAMRDTFNRTLTLQDGGRLTFTRDVSDGNRVFDFFERATVCVTGTRTSFIGGSAATADGETKEPIVNSGIIALRRPSGFAVDVADGASLDVFAQWGGAAGQTYPWTKTGGGLMSFYRASEQSGNLTIAAGAVRFVNKGQGTTGTVINQGELQVAASNGYVQTVVNVIQGVGGVRKLGPGTTVLTGVNAYSGVTTVEAGTLRVGGEKALGATSAILVRRGGVLDVGAYRLSSYVADLEPDAKIRLALDGEQAKGQVSFIKLGAFASGLTEAELREYFSVTVDGKELEPGNFRIVITDGVAEYQPLTLVGYNFPLETQVAVSNDWCGFAWFDQLHAAFTNSWTQYASAGAVVNVAAGDAGMMTFEQNVTVPRLTVRNCGERLVIGGGAKTLKVTEAVDATGSASGSVTFLDFNLGAADIATGAGETVLRPGFSGTLTTRDGSVVTVTNGIGRGTAVLSAGAELRFLGTEPLNELPWCSTDNRTGAWIGYGFPIDADEIAFGGVGDSPGATYGNFHFQGNLQLTTRRFVAGNGTGCVEYFRQSGGAISVTGNGDGSTTTTSTVLLGHWPSTIAWSQTGGSFVATNAPTILGWDGKVDWMTSGGVTRLKGLWAKRASGHDNTSSFTLSGGRLEIGDGGIAFQNRGAHNAALTLAGGILEAYDNATVSVEKGISVAGDATVSAVGGTVLTVAAVVAGSGTLTAAGAGTVRFTGDCSAARLAGTFQIAITEAQRTGGSSTALFTVPEGAEMPTVTIVNADGTAAAGGSGRIANGQYHWVPDGKYVQPISTTVSGDMAWENLVWTDGSGANVPKSALSDGMELEITTLADARLTFNESVSLGVVRFKGDRTLTLAVSPGGQLFGCAFTVGQAEVYASVVHSGEGITTFTKVTQLAEGATLTANAAARVVSFGAGPFYGTFVCNGFDPGTTWAVFRDPVRWHGTLVIAKNLTLDLNTALDNYGQANSVLELAGDNVGYLPKSGKASVPLRLSGRMLFNNGFSTDGGFTFVGALSGDGTIATDVNASGNPITDVLRFNGDVSGFVGAVDVRGGHCVSFGALADDDTSRNMIVVRTASPFIAADRQWRAQSGLSVRSGGILSVAYRGDGTAAFAGDVSVDGGGALNLKRDSSDEKTFAIAAGTLTLAEGSGLTLNGVQVPSWGYERAGGTITLKDKAVCRLPVRAVVTGDRALTQLEFLDASEPAQRFEIAELLQVAGLEVDFTFSEGAALTLDANLNASVFRIFGGRATICGSTGTTAVMAGVDTTLDTEGLGTLTVGPGMKATVPCWAKDKVALSAGGWLKFTGGDATRYPSDNAVAGATVELAGDGYVLDCNGASGGQLTSGATLLVSGGNVDIVNGENGMKPDSTLRVTGGTVTLDSRFICGQAGAGAVGAPGISYIDVQGGELTCAENGGHVYVGAADYTAVRLTVSGGRFSAMYAPYGGNNYAGIRLCYGFVSVSGDGIFAPKMISTSDPMNVATTVADYAVAGGNYNHSLTLSDGGTFLAPAVSPNWFAVSVTNGVGNMGAAAPEATAFVKGPITVDAGCMLNVTQGTVKLGAAIQGDGTVNVAEGATLDLNGCCVRNVTGSGMVTNSGDAAGCVIYDAAFNTNLIFNCSVAIDGAVLQVAEYRQTLPLICKGSGTVTSMKGLRVRVGDVFVTHVWRLCDDRRSIIACEPYTANVNASTPWQNGNGEGLSDHVQFVSGEETLIVLTNRAAEATLTFDTDTVASRLSVVSMAADALTLMTNATASLRIGAYDFSQAKGRVELAADAGDAAVTAGADTVLRSGGRGTLTIPAGACATVGGAFAGYVNAGTLDRDYALGTVDYETALVGDRTATNLFRSVVFTGVAPATTAVVRVETGDCVTLRSPADGCRMSTTFDIHGGCVLAEDTSLGFCDAPRITLRGTGLMRAKGVFEAQGDAVLTLADAARFELGSLGWRANAADFKMAGGTFSTFDDATMENAISLVGDGATIAAHTGTVLTLATDVTGEHALTVGSAVSNDTGLVRVVGSRIRCAMLTLAAGALTVERSATLETDRVIVSDGTLQLDTCDEPSAFVVSGPGTLAIRLTDAEARLIDDFATNVRVDPDQTPTLRLLDAVGAEIADRTAFVADGVVKVRLAAGYEKLGWNGTDACWTNAVGEARNVTEMSVLVAQDGDVIDYATAVTPHVLVLPERGAVTIGKHWNVGALSVGVPENLVLTLLGVDAATMVFSGAGTIALDCGSTTEYTQTLPIADVNLAEGFTGGITLLRGQFKATAPLRASVPIAIVDGAQLFASAGEWNNRFLLSGDGWGKCEGTWDRAALRIDGSLGRAATVEFLKTDDIVPAIGCYNSTRDIAGTLVGTDGFRVVGGGTLRFTVPKTQAANLHGTVTLESGNVQLGSNNGGFVKGDAMSLGDKIVVPTGRTLTLHAWTGIGADYAASSKVTLATPVTLNGGTLASQDGAYAFARITVSGTSTVSAGWQKGWLFQDLNVPSDATLNFNVWGSDGRLAFVGVDAGRCAGTFRVTNSSSADTRFSPAGTVFAEGTLAFAGSRKTRIELRDDAAFGVLSGAEAVYGDGTPRTLTLTAGTHAETLQDRADGTATAEGALSLRVTGDVTLTGMNTYSGTTTVAKGATLRLGTMRPTVPFATASQGVIALTLTVDEKAQYAAGTLVINFACDATAEGAFGGRFDVYDTDGVTPLYADVGIVRVGDAYCLQVRKVPAASFVPPYVGVVTQDVTWMQAAWTDSSVPSRAVTADGWNETVDASVSFTNGTAALSADRDVYLGAFVVTNTGAQLTVANGANRIAVRTIDDAASTGRTVFDFPAAVDAVAAGADTVLTAAQVGKLTVGDGKKATLGAAAAAASVSMAATGWVRRDGALSGTDNFATLIPSAGTYEFKDASIRGNMENKSYYGRTLVVREGDRVMLTTTGSHGGTDLSVCVCGGTLDYTTAATWFCSDVQYVQSNGVVTFAATGDGTDNAKAVIPGYTGGSKVASMEISGGLTDISKTSIRFDQASEIRVRGTGTLKVKGINGNTGRQHPVAVSERATLLLGGNGWKSGVGALTLNGGTLGTFENAEMAAGTTVSGASVLAATNGTTLTVTGTLSGSGDLTVGAEGYLGTVILRQLTSAYGGTFAVTEGATLVFDLSSSTAAWPLTGAIGKVVVDVTGRVFTGLDQGVRLIAWNQAPAAVFTGVGLPTGTALKTEADGLYLLEQVTPAVVPPEQGTASEPTGSGTAAVIVITPHVGVGALDINPPDGYAGKYEIPVSVTNVTGVTVAQLIVRSGAFDVAPACKLAGTALVLDAHAQVAVGTEVIPVTPTLSASGEAVEPFVVTDSHAAVGVKTVPGLSYQLLRGTAPTVIDTPVGDVVLASTSRTELRDPAKPQGAAFYRVSVSK